MWAAFHKTRFYNGLTDFHQQSISVVNPYALT
jgi:hypothetical protein